MKYLLHTFYLLTTLFFITSCGVDRSGEYYALVGDDMWIEEVMRNSHRFRSNQQAVAIHVEYRTHRIGGQITPTHHDRIGR